MGMETGISWTDHTFNIVWGCEKVSPACDFCYAEAFAHRMGFDVWGKDKPRRVFGPAHWNEPLKAPIPKSAKSAKSSPKKKKKA